MEQPERDNFGGGTNKPGRILFFGRAGCEATQKAKAYLSVLGFEVIFVESQGRGQSLPEALRDWVGDYIFCFRSFFVLPAWLIDKAGVAAINFHPAPVEYPGSGCLNFALYDNATHYGVTAHIMNERVDNGAIVECRRFPIMPADTVDSLLARTHVKLLDLFFGVTTELAIGGRAALTGMLKKSAGERWSGEARRMGDFEKLKAIPLDVTEAELLRIVRATYTEKFPPAVRIHGFDFVLKSPVRAGH